MQIGKIDVSTPTLVYGVILVALLVIVPSMGFARWAAIRDSQRRDVIVDAAVQGGESLEGGIAACKAMIDADPTKIAPRLYLGSLLAASKSYAEASDAFARVQDWKGATDEEKSLALTGAGCALCLDGAVDGKPKHLDEAERMLQKALEFKETPDALAAMALIKSWKSGIGAADVQALTKRALAADPAPAPALLVELYKLNGAILSANHQPSEASAAFGSAKVLNPADKEMDNLGRLTLLAGLLEPGTPPAARRVAIAKVNQELDKFGTLRNDALLSIGMAWHLLKGEKDYLDLKGPFDSSVAAFKLLLEIDPKDTRAYQNYASLLEEQIEALASELSVQVTGLKGETPPLEAWAPKSAASKEPGMENAPLMAGAPPDDQTKLSKIAALLRDEQNLWEQVLTRCKPEKTDAIDAQLRLIACARRRVFLGPWVKTLRRDESGMPMMDSAEVELLKNAEKVARELETLDETGRGSYTLGLVLIEKGDLASARAALLESEKRGFKSDAAAKLLAAMNAKTEIVDAGPNPLERQFSTPPLIHAAFRTPLGVSALKGLKVSVNGKDVPATAYGSQMLYIPRDTELGGGSHTVKFTASDSTGTPLTFPEFTYSVDKDPPTWSMQPAGGTLKPDVVLSISVQDPSGVEWASLSAGINSLKAPGGAPFNAVLIKDGHYAHALPAIKVKTNDAIAQSPFKLSTPNPLAAGDYKIWIEVKDQAGNKLRDEKAFSIK